MVPIRQVFGAVAAAAVAAAACSPPAPEPEPVGELTPTAAEVPVCGPEWECPRARGCVRVGHRGGVSSLCAAGGETGCEYLICPEGWRCLAHLTHPAMVFCSQTGDD
jgi:hypothetical protein